MYGKTRKIEGDQNLIPFLYQGQYYDHDIELAYNRFRYYNPETGLYLSQDPIGLAGNNPTFYAYVHDSNSWVDPFGLIGEEFDVGLHENLLKQKTNPDLRSHHVGQKVIMKDLVANYDEMKAPAILVDKVGHNNKKPGYEPGIVSRSKINSKTGKPFGSARDLLARDIRELRRVYPNVPNSKLKELIDLNKKMYPEMNKKPKVSCH
ncbi:RHS repeat domain-containing protein [Flavobacterium columnare]|uniref:RHS repeat domain-containing protein n=1 Tax=Flavobacterium columnare TaxID=996 RepID=UPI00293718DB|nr:RHS repeat-associated core domain-containing protein [Flavobacterium columnare]